jgi:hypothetical protein
MQHGVSLEGRERGRPTAAVRAGFTVRDSAPGAMRDTAWSGVPQFGIGRVDFALNAERARRSEFMSLRIDKTWIVMESIENFEADRCVDIFKRPDGTFGFEEFRRDVEDSGRWTPTACYSPKTFPGANEALAAATSAVRWLAEKLNRSP